MQIQQRVLAQPLCDTDPLHMKRSQIVLLPPKPTYARKAHQYAMIRHDVEEIVEETYFYKGRRCYR